MFGHKDGAPPLSLCAPESTLAHSRRRRNAKVHKVLEGKLQFVLGRDVFMEWVEALCSRALIGRLEYCQLGKKDWISWARRTGSLYSPTCLRSVYCQRLVGYRLFGRCSCHVCVKFFVEHWRGLFGSGSLACSLRPIKAAGKETSPVGLTSRPTFPSVELLSARGCW